MQKITLKPHNDQQMRLIKLLAKTLNIKVTVRKEGLKSEKYTSLQSIKQG